MLVHMTHPQHGIHIAYSDVEVAACEKNGWTLKKEDAKPERVEAPSTPAVFSRRRGRPRKGS